MDATLKGALEKALDLFNESNNRTIIVRKELDSKFWWYAEKAFYDNVSWDVLKESQVVIQLNKENGLQVIKGLSDMSHDECMLVVKMNTALNNKAPVPPWSIETPQKPAFDLIPDLPKEELWWQKEHREKSEAVHNMIAMRNHVRKLIGL